MSQIYDTEEVENEVKALLESELPARLDEIDADKNDGLVLADPAEYYIGRWHKNHPHKLPAIFIGGSVSTQEETGLKYKWIHTIDITLELKESDIGLGQKLAKRYGKGIFLVFAAKHQLSQKVISANVRRVDFGFTEATREHSMMIATIEVLTRTPMNP